MPALNIYKIVRNDEVDYDSIRAMIVIAATPGDAREVARTERIPEGDGVWYRDTTTVELIGRAAPFLAGQIVLKEGY